MSHPTLQPDRPKAEWRYSVVTTRGLPAKLIGDPELASQADDEYDAKAPPDQSA
jgi:hypothetical protein